MCNNPNLHLQQFIKFFISLVEAKLNLIEGYNFHENKKKICVGPSLDFNSVSVCIKS